MFEGFSVSLVSFQGCGPLFHTTKNALKEYRMYIKRYLKVGESMAKPKSTSGETGSKRRSRPGLTPESRENQLISYAVDLAEQQLRDGTASSQVITHYLKLGSTKARIEKEILEKQKDLLEAKTQALQSAQRVEELYANALEAMRTYSGNNND